MELLIFLILAFGLRLVWSSPIEARSPPKNECAVVDEIVLLLKLTGATPFCSSFLSIPVATSVSTVVSTTTIVQTTSPLTITTTTHYTSTETDVVSTTSTTATFTTVVTTDVITTTSTAVSTVTNTIFTNLGKRALREREIKIPPILKSFASSALSTACSCLSIPQSTIKTTTTSISKVPATATLSVIQTIAAVTTTSTTTVIPTVLVVPTFALTTVDVVTTKTMVAIATDCPQALLDPGFEGAKNPPQWQVTDDVSEGTYSEVYSDVPEYSHSGQNSFLFTFFNDNNFDGSLIFSLSQTTTICPHQQLTLGFWLRRDSEDYLTEPCNPQVCIGTLCQIFSIGAASDYKYGYYSFLGPVPDGSTSITIKVSADGGSHGTCTAESIYFDDFTLE